MDRKDPISDATISKNVTRQLSARGLRPPCRIQVRTRQGEVTLSGTVQFVHQRDAAVQAVRTVEGIKRLVENLKVTPPAKHQYGQPASGSSPTAHSEAPRADEPTAPPADQPEESQSAHDFSASAIDPVMSASKTTDYAVAGGATPPPAWRGRDDNAARLSHTRKGESYTFTCASLGEAQRLRALLGAYVDWLQKNSWVGEARADGEAHQVTFHCKSLIDFLRQEGF
ncbi:MAG TPA: BON domain-containing protein [Pirellulales bacterium]